MFLSVRACLLMCDYFFCPSWLEVMTSNQHMSHTDVINAERHPLLWDLRFAFRYLVNCFIES